MTNMPTILELSGADLDAVAGGANSLAAGGLVNLALSIDNIDVLRNADINVDVIDNVTLRDIANNNNVGVGALVNILGGPSAIINRQTP
jgi:hypothetical protein